MLKILVVDDEPDICALISDALVDEGHEVSCAADGAAALSLASATPFDVVVADMRLPKLDGLALFRRLREASPATDMILMTGNAAVADAVAVLKEGAFDYLAKPIRLEELVVQLTRIASFRALRRDVVEARAELTRGTPVLEQLIGHSPQMLAVVKRVETVANCDASVLIIGESGTGKELVAHALHAGSERRGKPFVAVNCAAFPDTLIEAELFGHERGAFTGATQRREGRFKAAHGGTLFLDEVAELSPAAQAKLLRVLQEGTIEPLGTNASIQVDVRIISATHQNLKSRVATGQFREDLYYRINTIDLAIPPLRQRSGDLAVLVRLFVQRFSKDRSPAPEVSWQAWNALSSYRFPGNVRELMHAIEHAVLLSRGGTIELEHLPVSVRGHRPPEMATLGTQMAPLSVALKEFEREYLIRVVSQFGGKRIQAAESLGISRKNLWEKLRTHGIDQPQETAARAPVC
ncbi:MAG TPA: sigma-54 dependent transcriptional regulator [Polyangia bacterium]|jgi:DNA-binding NtrC family response regulator|nr:sigma-54 dependent transcriptional regulator [Polyangia bacterium]